MTVRIIIEVPDEEVDAALALIDKSGLEWVEVKRSRAHKTSPRIAELVYNLYKSGLAVRDISRRTHVSRSTVSKIARDPKGYGLNRKPLSRQGRSEES